MSTEHPSLPSDCDESQEGKPDDSKDEVDIEPVEDDGKRKEVHVQCIATIGPEPHGRSMRLDVLAGKRFVRRLRRETCSERTDFFEQPLAISELPHENRHEYTLEKRPAVTHLF